MRIGASFSVGASTYREAEFDTTGMTVQQVVDRMYSECANPMLCNGCAREVSTPELDELTQITIDGVDYVQTESGEWLEYK